MTRVNALYPNRYNPKLPIQYALINGKRFANNTW